MSKKLIWIVIALSVLVIGGAVASIAGFFMFRAYQDRQNLAQAESYRAQGDYGLASNYFKAYLSRNREDIATLRAYAEMNEQTLSSRRVALTAAAHAYNQINSLQSDPEVQDTIIKLFKQVRSWGDVEYYAGLFLRERPDDPGLKYDIALAIDSQGRANEARDAYRALIDAGADDPQVYANLAGVLLRQGLQEQAAGVIAELESNLPDRNSTYVRVGEYYAEARDYERARAYAEKALSLAADDPDALFLKAQVFLLEGQPEQALEVARAGMAQAPDKARIHLLAAVAQNYMGDHAGAVDTLTALDPVIAVDNPEVLLALAESQISANRLADVEDTIARYRRSYPEMRLTLDYLEGRKALASGNASLAVTRLTNVVELNPSFASAQYYLAVALLQSQQRDRGRMALESYLQNHSADRQAKRLYDSEFGSPRDVANAQQRLEQILKTSTSADELFAAVRPILTSQPAAGAGKEANPVVIEALERILTLEPTYERAHQSLIFYQAERGKTSDARSSLERARTAGVPEENLLMASAAVALAEHSANAARAAFATAIGRQDFTVDKAIAWGNLFANAGELALGIDALSQAAEKNIGDAAAIIELEKPVLMARHDALDEALETLEALSAKYQNAASARDRLLELKLQFAQTLLKLDDPTRHTQAEALLDGVTALDPNNTNVPLVRVENLVRQSPPRYSEAVSLLDRVLALDKNNVHALVMLARIYGEQGNAEQALDYGRRAANVAVGNLDAQLLVAQLQYSLQRYRECQETLESLLATHPESILAMEMLAQCYMTTGRIQLAQSIVDDIEEAAGTDEAVLSRASVLRSRLLVSEGRRLDEAEALLRTQYDADPENTVIVSQLARAVAGQDRIAEAVTLLTDFANRLRDRPDGWYALGQFYLDQKGPEHASKATSAFTRALLIDANHVPSLRGQIEAQSRQGKPVETLQLAERYLEARPKDDVILFRKASVLYQLNRMDDAMDPINRALEIDERPDYFYLRASIYLAKQRYEEALSDLLNVRFDGAATANFDMALAEAYLGVGDRESAVLHFEAARSKSTPEDMVSPERIQRFEARLEEAPAA